MNCPNCHELVEADAAYCGNCGQPVHKVVALGSMSVTGAVPAYAIANPWQHVVETQSKMSIVLGVIGMAGSLFVPLLGIGFGLLGIVMGTLSRVSNKKTIRLVGLTVSSLAILTGLATWVYAVKSDPRFNPEVTKAVPSNDSTQSAASFTTPCYSLSFIDELNIDKGEKNCDISAYNGRTIDSSTNAYKVFSTKSNVTTANDFANMARTAVYKDVVSSLKGYDVISEKVSSFAGSPAYVLKAYDKINNISVTEALVMHEVSSGENVFVLLHANVGPTADLQILESSWQWK